VVVAIILQHKVDNQRIKHHSNSNNKAIMLHSNNSKAIKHLRNSNSLRITTKLMLKVVLCQAQILFQ